MEENARDFAPEDRSPVAALYDALEEDRFFRETEGELTLMEIGDDCVVVFEGEPEGTEEDRAFAAVFSSEQPNLEDLLFEVYRDPHQFLLPDPNEDEEPPVIVAVDPSPTRSLAKAYRVVEATTVSNVRFAAREIEARWRGETGDDPWPGEGAGAQTASGPDPATPAAGRGLPLGAPSPAEATRMALLGAEKRALAKEDVRAMRAYEALTAWDKVKVLLKTGKFPQPPKIGVSPRYARLEAEDAEEILYSDQPGIILCANNKGGVGKCVTFDTKLTDPVTGLRRTMEEFVRGPEFARVHTLEDRRTTTGIEITEKVDSGVKPTLKVRLRSGRSVTVTPHHPLLLPDGWRKTEDIEVGETIALAAREPFPEEPVRLADAEVDLLSAMLAEGGTTASSKTFTSADADMVKLVSRAAKDLGMKVSPKRDVKAQYFLSNIERYERDSERKGRVSAFLDRHNMNHTLAKNKRVPEAVYRLGPEQLSRFLAVFWMCDGYVDRTGPGVTLASKGLVEDVQHLLLRFGVQSGVRHKKAAYTTKDGERREFDAWRLSVYSQHRRRFRDAVPLWGEKRVRLDELCEKAHNPNGGSPTMTEKLRRELRTAAFGSPEVRSRGGAGHVPGGARSRGGNFAAASQEAPPSTKEVREKLGWSAFQMDFLEHRKDEKPSTIARKPFEAFCEVFGLEDEYGWLLDSLSGASDVFWDEVVSVEDAGEQRVYDLCVEPTRCFVAGDVIVHNTTTALNLAAALSKVAHPAGREWTKPLNVLLVEANYGNPDLALRMRLPAGRVGGFADFLADRERHLQKLEDLDRRGLAYDPEDPAGEVLQEPDIKKYVTPHSDAPFDVLLVNGTEYDRKIEGKVSYEDLEALYDSAARHYDILVVDLNNSMPGEENMRAEVARFWLEETDVVYLVCDRTPNSYDQAAHFREDAEKYFEEIGRPEEAPSMVLLMNKWKEPGDGADGLGDDEETFWANPWVKAVEAVKADPPIGAEGEVTAFLRIHDDDTVDEFTRERRAIALESPGWRDDYELVCADALQRITQRCRRQRLAQDPGGR